jgi:hypothetical protein
VCSNDEQRSIRAKVQELLDAQRRACFAPAAAVDGDLGLREDLLHVPLVAVRPEQEHEVGPVVRGQLDAREDARGAPDSSCGLLDVRDAVRRVVVRHRSGVQPGVARGLDPPPPVGLRTPCPSEVMRGGRVQMKVETPPA